MRKGNIAVALLWLSGGLMVTGAAFAMLRPRVAAPVPSAAGSQAAAPASPPTIYFVKNPEAAPAFQSRDIVSGKNISGADWKGKAILLNFWATWCPPCRAEIPGLIALQKKYEGRLQIIGVSEDEDPPEQVLKFVKQVGINYPVVMATPELLKAWGGVEALPTTFLVSPEGRVLTKHRGLYSADQADLEARALMGQTVEAKIETLPDTGQVFLKNTANATELPEVNMVGLTADQKKRALHRLNAETCTCGCTLTIAQCRLNDTTCPTSRDLAAKIVKEVKAGGSATPGAPAKAPTAIKPAA
jgi:thiol-disulfide isomerase/thioredoxin